MVGSTKFILLRTLANLAIPILVAAGLVAGFVREIFFAYMFGSSTEIEVIRVAIGLPGILSDGLAVSFVAVLLPCMLERSDGKSVAAIQTVLWPSTIVVVIIFLLGLITMPIQAQVLAPGLSAQNPDSILIAGKFCWIMFLAVVLSLPLRAWLSLNTCIWPGAAAQLLKTGGLIAGLTGFFVFNGIATAVSGAIAAAIGGALVLVAHIVALGQLGRQKTWSAITGGLIRRDFVFVVRALIFVFLTQIIMSAGRLVDRSVASSMEQGTLANLEYSYGLVMAFAMLFGTSANLILAPRIGRLFAQQGDLPSSTWRTIILLSIAALVCGSFLSAFSTGIVRLVFARGAFDSTDVSQTALIFGWHALALGPLVLSLLLTQILILGGAAKLALWAASLKLVIKIGLLYYLLVQGWGAEGLAISLGLAEIISAFVLIVFVMHSLRARRASFRPVNQTLGKV